PDQVLDVGLETNLDDLKVKVVHTHGRRGEKYMTLSHCWGPRSHVTTQLTTQCLVEYETEGISLQQLPNTFRHAVLFTRELGVRYLWIDPLCIIQDDTQDWERESVTMRSVYENSHLTIAAAASPSAQGGLFPFLPPKHPPHNISGTTPDGKPFELSASLRMDHSGSKLPLLKRGWAFQERNLSPRTLFFAEREVLWECKTELDCQCEFGGFYEEENMKSWHHLLAPETAAMSRADKLDQFQLWHKLVKYYSSLELSVKSDRLPAISGIAEVIRRLRGLQLTDYYYGLWSDSFPFDLSWYQLVPGAERHSGVPSWSWASVHNQVHFPFFLWK
ncbi:heterokaryon incompatibility protein-domain-containing protein, partial [Podospora aff. communis PSN243]